MIGGQVEGTGPGQTVRREGSARGRKEKDGECKGHHGRPRTVTQQF